MKLRKINNRTYVNIGDGRILKVVDTRGPLADKPWVTITFIGGWETTVHEPIEDVIASLEKETA